MEKPKTPIELQGEIGRLEAKIASLESAVVELKLNTDALQKNESNLLSLLRSMVDLVFVIGLDGNFARYYQDPNREDLFLLPKQFLGKSVRDVFPAETADVFLKAINAVETYGQTQNFDFFLPIKQREFWFNARISLYKPASGEFLGYILEMCNITDRKRMEEALRESEARYRAVMRQSTLCIFLADIDTRVILDTNQAMQRLLGYTSEDLSGLSLYDLMEKEKEDIYRKILQILMERSYYIGERRFRRKDGSTVDVEISVNLIGYRGKEVMCVVARDITPRRLAERQLTHTATHDPLTNLVNRMLLYDRLAQELARARRHSRKIALVNIDLNRFKRVNDTLGHGVGDQLLKAVGSRLKSLLRESDTLARMGGDEFLVVLPDIKQEDDVIRVAENILQAVRNPFDIESFQIPITASVGIAFFPVDGKDSEALMKAADLAMYEAKSQGGNVYCRYSSELKFKSLIPQS
jgi:diguanylate cyclase (GGDEF)-like protein/PAS domain S-box-containing protein